MDRIIINERDNTTNVESLSSYDVVYVPGFSAAPNSENYRTPVLVTNKYTFINTFGENIPKFAEDQLYYEGPLDSSGKPTDLLFPEEAIPNFSNFTVTQLTDTNTFQDETFITAYFEVVNAKITEEDLTGIKYYGLKQNETNVVLETIDGEPADVVSAVNTIIDEEDETYTKVFSSSFNPSENDWYVIGADSQYVKTTDTYIKNTANSPTTYYVKEEGLSPMFAAGDADPGYRYALALLSRGMPVYYEQMNTSLDDITIESMYSGLIARFGGVPVGEGTEYSDETSFDSMGDYAVKFITSGGYPVFEYTKADLTTAMMTMARNRKDSIALIDHTDNPDRPLTSHDDTSVINSIRATSFDSSIETYGAMFTPWFECNDPVISYDRTNEDIKNKMMPGSFAYLSSLANQIQSYNPWLAVSGVTRGRVPYCSKLHTNRPLTNNIADSYQVLPGDNISGVYISINPITYIRNYGYCIWGNRTLKNNRDGTQASSFLNIRSTVCDIKKRLFEASQRLLFEQNTDILWLNFRSIITPLLDTMQADYILSDYTITRLYVDPTSGKTVPAYEVMAVIRIQPINAVEIFELTVLLENNDEFNIVTTSVTENEE